MDLKSQEYSGGGSNNALAGGNGHVLKTRKNVKRSRLGC